MRRAPVLHNILKMTNSSNDKHHRPIRSFVRREGRITKRQEAAIETLWPRYGIEVGSDLPQSTLDFSVQFARQAPHVVEIGFGMGHSLLAMAQATPSVDFIGIEVHRPGVGSLLADIDKAQINNIRIINHDASEVFAKYIRDASLDGVNIFFPDPWPKKRHHKRRLVQLAFVELLAAKLKQGGRLHLATDWENYAEQMLEVVSQVPLLINASGAGNFAQDRGGRPQTKFERRGQARGHGVWDLVFIRE